MLLTVFYPIQRSLRICCLMVLLFLSACGLAPAIPSTGSAQSGAPTNDASMNMTMSAPAASEAPAAPVTGPHVDIANFTFSPASLTVPAGSTVTWINQDDIPHTVTSVDGIFKSGALDTGDRYAFKFIKPGTYTYFCSIHPKMVGKIVVK